MYIGLTKRPVNLMRVYRPLLRAQGLCAQQAFVDPKDGDSASADKQAKRLKTRVTDLIFTLSIMWAYVSKQCWRQQGNRREKRRG